MIANWIRQDPAGRPSLPWLFIGPLTMNALLSAVTWNAASAARAAQSGPGSWTVTSFTIWAGLFWFAVGPHFLAPEIRERCSRLTLTLPLSPRKLWLTHLVAVFSSGMLFLLVAAGFVLLTAWILVYVLKGRNPFEPDVLRLAIHLASGLVLTTVLLQIPKPSLHRIPLSMGYALYTVATVLGVLAVILIFGSLPLPFAILPLVAAVAIGWRTYQALPTSFSLVPSEAEAPSRRAWHEDSARPAEGVAYRWFLCRTLSRSLYGRNLQYWWLAAPFLLCMGAPLAGITWMESSDLYYLRYSLIPIAIYMLLAFVGSPMRNLYRMDPLPISRRGLFAMVFIPSLVFLVLGYGGGKLWGAMVAEPREQLVYRLEPDSHYYLYVPIGATEIAWNGHPPANSSPWGESQEAWRAPIYRGSGAVFFSPYHTPIGSSLDFVALQISRATEAIYEEAIPPEEIKDRYLTIDEEGNVILKGEALTLRADFPYLKPRSKGPLFPVILTLVALPWAFFLAVYLRSFRATISDRKRLVLLFGMMFVLLAIFLGHYALFLNDITTDWKIVGLVEILVRKMSANLPGTLAIWSVCALLVYASYRFAESQFLRIEASPTPGRMHPFEAWASN